jgi:hypothetical protein
MDTAITHFSSPQSNKIDFRTYGIASIANSILNIYILRQSYILCIVDEQKNEITAVVKRDIAYCNDMDYILLKIKNDVADEPIFNLIFKEKNIIFSNAPCAMIPNEFVGQSSNTEVYSQYFAEEKEQFYADTIFTVGAQAIYGVSYRSKGMIEEMHISNFSHIYASLIPYWARNNAERAAYLHILDGACIIGVLENKNLCFINLYQFENKEEMLYFIIAVFEKLHLNVERTVLHVTGIIDETSEGYEMIYTYIRNVQLTRVHSSYTLASTPSFPLHYFPEIFN